MTHYRNQQPNAAVSMVEFAPVAEGNFSFFYAGSPLRRDEVRAWLTSPEMGQEIIAETMVDGQPVFVTHGDKPRSEILKLMEARGDRLAQEKHKRQFDPWVARAVLGFGGQSLQLFSSTMGRDHRVDWSTALFSISNLAANTIALVYGAQKSEDKHRLRFLKDKFNDDLGKQADGAALPVKEKSHLELQEKPQDFSRSLHGFLERHSVRVGELALRYLGAVSLIFPTYGWGRGWKHYKQTGSLKGSMAVIKNRDRWAYHTGIVSVVGKTIALTSKEIDPYNPKPHTFLDTIREKVTFPLGGLIEAAAFGGYSYDRFANHRIYFQGKSYRDYLGGIGSAMFVAAYLIRAGWAKFSEKNVDMDALYAHVSDSLAVVPPEKLPQLMADTAASIKAHFKDKPMEFGTVFTRLMTDAYRYHHIALQNAPESPISEEGTSVAAPVTSRRTLITRRGYKELIGAAALSHSEKIAAENKARPELGA